MRRFLLIVISALTGACFAVLAALSIAAAIHPPRRFHPFSVVIAVVSVVFGFIALRAAIKGRHEEEMALVNALRRGMFGAFVGLVAMVVVFLFFRPDENALFAHALGDPAYIFTDFRLLAGSVLLGFGTGLVVGMPCHSE